MARPTATQAEALRQMIAHDGRLLREPGGFWTYPEAPRAQRGFGELEKTPVWWVTVQTVRALERNGWVKRADVQDEWRDDRLVTSRGRAALVPQTGS